MGTNLKRFEKKLNSLERIRNDVANKLDRSYLQNNVSELLALEEKYEIIVHRISRIKTILANQSGARTTI